tara:strand:- start:132 stop:470 length:339 start_codon:yes stop_codon:yes gene_type:complete
MPKTIVNYNNKITLKISEQFLNYMNIARASSTAKDKFGKHPTQTEFLRGIIYQWIKTYTPEIIIDDIEGNVPEIIEHKEIKEKHAQVINDIIDYNNWHFEQKNKEMTHQIRK